MSSITGDFIASNKISVEKYLLDEHLEVYLKTKTRSAVSVCIDYIYGLILLPKRKNMSKNLALKVEIEDKINKLMKIFLE